MNNFQSLDLIFKEKIDKYINEKIINLLEKKGKTKLFLSRYIINSVLSYLEKLDQQNINGMNYEKWNIIKLDIVNDIKRSIEENLLRLIKACDISNIADIDLPEDIVYEILYLLIKYPLYKGNLIRAVISEDDIESLEDFKRKVSSSGVKIRTILSEIALILYKVKQRFPDRSIFFSPRLVDRVFAFVEPRMLPLDVVDIYDIKERIKVLAVNIYKLFVRYLFSIYSSNYEYISEYSYKDELCRILNIFFEYLIKEVGIRRFYRFQVEGICGILESQLNLLDATLKYSNNSVIKKGIILQAPTGAGKTEVFVISSLIIALAHKLAVYEVEKNLNDVSPIIFIIYPRRALATDQLKRLITYAYYINKAAKEVLNLRDPILRISISYTEVQGIREYSTALKRTFAKLNTDFKPIPIGRPDLRIYVRAKRDKDRIILEIPFLWDPKGSKHPLVVLRRIHSIYDLKEEKIKKFFEKLYCSSDIVLDFISFTRDHAYEQPGDIHITLGETLRRNLLRAKAAKIFGKGKGIGPAVFILDEVHLLKGIYGSRIAYLLARTLYRVYKLKNSKRRPSLFIGVSATIPNAEEFSSKLFGINRKNVKVISVKEEDKVPLGNEYFLIIVPTTLEMVDNLTVSIQAIMVLHYNMPSYTKLKKSFIFADNLDIVRRLQITLNDALWRNNIKGGLQDLRNIYHMLFELTADELDIKRKDLEEVQKELLKGSLSALLNNSKVNSARLLGELWWSYSLEYIHRPYIKKPKIARYTGRVKENIEIADIVVTDPALEVGVDYRNVILIYQHGMPMSISALIQRAGRGGRIIRENPLVRVAIAIMLSPYIPSQAALIEMLIRIKDLRELLKKEKLNLPFTSEKILEQTIAEFILDIIALKKANEGINRSCPLYIRESDIDKFIEEYKLAVNNKLRINSKTINILEEIMFMLKLSPLALAFNEEEIFKLFTKFKMKINRKFR